MIGFGIQIAYKNTDPQISKVGLPIREKKTMVITFIMVHSLQLYTILL